MRGVEYIKIGPSPFSAFLLKFNMRARKPDWIKKRHKLDKGGLTGEVTTKISNIMLFSMVVVSKRFLKIL